VLHGPSSLADILFLHYWLFVNLLFTKEDKMLIKNLSELKGYNAKHLVREFPSKGWDVSSIYKLLQKLRVLGRSTIVLAVADDAALTQLITLISLTNWCYTKMARR